MPELSAAALLEVLGATVTNVGLALVAASLLIRCFYTAWHKTDAIHILQDGAHFLRWHTRTTLHEEPWPRPPAFAPAPGERVVVYYHDRHPYRWALIAPYRHTWVLLGVGAVLIGLGIFLPLLPG